MLNKDPNTASDFHDTLAQEVPIQLPGFGLNWQMDSIGRRDKPRQPVFPSLVKPFLHLQRWNKANFKVPEDQLHQGSLQWYVSRQCGTEPHFKKIRRKVLSKSSLRYTRIHECQKKKSPHQRSNCLVSYHKLLFTPSPPNPRTCRLLCLNPTMVSSSLTQSITAARYFVPRFV